MEQRFSNDKTDNNRIFILVSESARIPLHLQRARSLCFLYQDPDGYAHASYCDAELQLLETRTGVCH